MPNTLPLPRIGYVSSDNYRTFYCHVIEDIVAHKPAHRFGC